MEAFTSQKGEKGGERGCLQLALRCRLQRPELRGRLADFRLVANGRWRAHGALATPRRSEKGGDDGGAAAVETVGRAHGAPQVTQTLHWARRPKRDEEANSCMPLQRGHRCGAAGHRANEPRSTARDGAGPAWHPLHLPRIGAVPGAPTPPSRRRARRRPRTRQVPPNEQVQSLCEGLLVHEPPQQSRPPPAHRGPPGVGAAVSAARVGPPRGRRRRAAAQMGRAHTRPRPGSGRAAARGRRDGRPRRPEDNARQAWRGGHSTPARVHRARTRRTGTDASHRGAAAGRESHFSGARSVAGKRAPNRCAWRRAGS